jgi:UDP-N-acetylglucosamine--N-acetylmuramyl-(pentapeptide) pyrophosphoryl-undecaprenol N-acetylglucosamine transferase
MKFVMAGGGTGGHVIPAVAVAQELRRRGHEPVFFGTRHGYEARLVPAAGFAIEWIEAGGLNRVSPGRRLRSLLVIPASVLRVWFWLGRNRPGAVFSMGGYVAGPVLIAAILRGVPVVAMEPNAVPGMANRKAARWTARALVNFPETASFFPPGRTEVTGVPVKEEFFEVGRRPGAGALNLLVTGGSQGSRSLNNAGRDTWQLFARAGMPVRIVHQAGKGNAAALLDAFRDSGLQGQVVEFIQDMPAAFAEADIIVCRSGASTVSELAAAGRASILVPFPYAADDHQQRNAEAMARAGAAKVVRDNELSGRRLFEEVMSLARNRTALEAMAEAARKLAKPNAARRAAEVLEQVAVR